MRKAISKGAAGRTGTPARDIDAYLAAVPQAPRRALERLRKTIKAAAPKATEVISYRIPTFRYHGGLVAFAAFQKHCSLFVMSKRVMNAYRNELKPYDTTAGATVHFSVEKPLPAALITKLVKARIAENQARRTGRQ